MVVGFGVKKESLWRRIIVSKCTEDEQDWVSNKIPEYRVLSLWGIISKFGEELNA